MSTATATIRADVYTRVTDRIIVDLELGCISRSLQRTKGCARDAR